MGEGLRRRMWGEGLRRRMWGGSEEEDVGRV